MPSCVALTSLRVRSRWPIAFALVGCAGWLSASKALADPQGLSTNVPVQIEDAFPAVKFGEGEFQIDNRLTHDSGDPSGPNLLTSSPTLKIGAAPRLQVDIGPSYSFGGQGGANSGAVSIDALYQFTRNTTYLPALALHVFYDAPYGAHHGSQDYTVRAIATKYLGPDERAPRLHVNLTWTRTLHPGAEERSDQYEAAVGYSRRVGEHTALVVDAVHGDNATVREHHTYLDIGFIHEVNSLLTVSIGAGAGVAQQSADGRLFFAVQRSFNLFGGS